MSPFRRLRSIRSPFRRPFDPWNALLLASLLASPLHARQVAELDTTFGVEGVARFDLGRDYRLCDAEVVSDGSTVVALSTRNGSEIWAVNANGSDATQLRSYAFTEATGDCSYGIRALVCPDSEASCYGTGRRALGGNDLTWIVAFDRRTGAMGGPLLPSGSSLVDLAAGGVEQANDIVITRGATSAAGRVSTSSTRGSETVGIRSESSIVAVGSQDGLGFVATRNANGGFDINTLQIEGDDTTIERAWEEDGTLWVQGRTREYIFVCKYDARLPSLGGGWSPSTTFGVETPPGSGIRNGCTKVKVLFPNQGATDITVHGFKVFGGEPVVLYDIDFGVAGRDLRQRRFQSDGTPEDPFQLADADAGSTSTPSLTCDPSSGRPTAQYETSEGLVVRDLETARGFKVGVPAYDTAALIVGKDLSTPGVEEPRDTFVSIGRSGPDPDDELVVARVLPPISECQADSETACLGGFEVTVTYEDFAGNTGNALVVPGGTPDSGLFYFFGPDNWEMLVKVLDACGFNGYSWVLAAATTNILFQLQVCDAEDPEICRYYENPLGTNADATIDTSAFACTEDQITAARERTRRDPTGFDRRLGALGDDFSVASARMAAASTSGVGGECSDSSTTLCLTPNRFRVELEWRDFEGNPGSGTVASLRSADSGLFTFFDPDNWEVLVKVLDACGVNGNYWVLAAATTNLEFELTVTDTLTGEQFRSRNEAGSAAPAVIATDAFTRACPGS